VRSSLTDLCSTYVVTSPFAPKHVSSSSSTPATSLPCQALPTLRFATSSIYTHRALNRPSPGTSRPSIQRRLPEELGEIDDTFLTRGSPISLHSFKLHSFSSAIVASTGSLRVRGIPTVIPSVLVRPGLRLRFHCGSATPPYLDKSLQLSLSGT
jgi:hypothetical protein